MIIVVCLNSKKEQIRKKHVIKDSFLSFCTSCLQVKKYVTNWIFMLSELDSACTLPT